VVQALLRSISQKTLNNCIRTFEELIAIINCLDLLNLADFFSQLGSNFGWPHNLLRSTENLCELLPLLPADAQNIVLRQLNPGDRQRLLGKAEQLSAVLYQLVRCPNSADMISFVSRSIQTVDKLVVVLSWLPHEITDEQRIRILREQPSLLHITDETQFFAVLKQFPYGYWVDFSQIEQEVLPTLLKRPNACTAFRREFCSGNGGCTDGLAVPVFALLRGMVSAENHQFFWLKVRLLNHLGEQHPQYERCLNAETVDQLEACVRPRQHAASSVSFFKTLAQSASSSSSTSGLMSKWMEKKAVPSESSMTKAPSIELVWEEMQMTYHQMFPEEACAISSLGMR
jgi:hypothetical protein